MKKYLSEDDIRKIFTDPHSLKKGIKLWKTAEKGGESFIRDIKNERKKLLERTPNVSVARNSSRSFGLLGANALGQQRTYGYGASHHRPNARFRLALRMSADVVRNARVRSKGRIKNDSEA